ncbi:MAG: HAMP domain-containing protein, partial [Deltaproteobacteria bacterium]|nr:HAMP domain-containing protein [Deltaproteobacteria bacterium]
MVSKRARFALWWRRSGMGLRAAVFLLGSVLFGLLVYWLNPPEQSDYLGTNLLIFGLVNFNIVILGILIFLVGRNVVKLVLDRKRSILGSRLRMRLVMAFVGLTLVPTVILFVMASGLLNRVMEGWFSTQVEIAVGGAVEVARQHYNTLSDGLRRVSQGIVREIKEKPLIYSQTSAVRELLEQRRKQQRLFSVTLVDHSLGVAARAQHAAAAIETFQEPKLDVGALQRALAGESVLLYESQDASQFARFYQAVAFQGNPAVLVTALRFNPKLSQALTKVNDSFKEYESLKLFRIPLRSGYILTLAMITSLILFSAIWVGFYMAREIAVPIQRLAEGTQRVARGDYDFQIRAAGDDEITFLVRSFNKMTADLKLSRLEAERRRVYLETVLANLAVAVVALDVGDFVTSVNAAAARLFGKPDAGAVVGLGLQEALGQRVYKQIEALLAQIKSARIQSPQDMGGPMEQELSIDTAGGVRKIICTAGSIVDAKDDLLGTVLLFDDVTDLAKAQQMAAWREVARRIAHEIKNPLTPIQLSAQRLERLGLARGEEQIVESSKTIVEQVVSIKRLADEFSKF